MEQGSTPRRSLARVRAAPLRWPRMLVAVALAKDDVREHDSPDRSMIRLVPGRMGGCGGSAMALQPRRYPGEMQRSAR